MPESSLRQRLLFAAAILYTVCIYGTMAVMSIGAGVTGAAWLVLRWGSHREDWRRVRASPVFWPTLYLAVACLWSLVWAKLSGLTFYGARPTVTWDDTRKTWHLFFPFILFALFASLSAAHLRKVVKAWLGLGVASAVLGIVQHYVPIYEPMRVPQTWSDAYTRDTSWTAHLHGLYHATGFAGFHLSFASIIAFPSAVALAVIAVLYRRERLSRRTWLAAGGALLLFIANILTFSKIAWLAMPLTVVLISLVGFKGRPRYVLLGLIALFCVAFSTSVDFRERFLGSRITVNERVELWDANLEMIRQFPVFGVGWHRNSELSGAYFKAKNYFSIESHAHNNILDQWSTTGLAGLAGFVWLNAVLFLMSFRLYKSSHDLLWRSLGLGLVGGWFCLQLNGLTQVNWWDAKVMHQIGWVTAMTMEAYRRYRPDRIQT